MVTLRGSERLRVARGLGALALCHAWDLHHADEADEPRDSAILDRTCKALAQVAPPAALGRTVVSWTEFILLASGAVPWGALPAQARARGETVQASTTFIDEDDKPLSEGDLPPAVLAATRLITAATAGDEAMVCDMLAAAEELGHLGEVLGHAAMAVGSMALGLGVLREGISLDRMGERLHCPGCTVGIGVLHAATCAHGWCRGTGRELSLCSETRHLGPCEPGVWDGAAPGTAEAVGAGFFHRATPAGWQPCPMEHPDAEPDIDRMRAAGRWDVQEQWWVPA